MHRQGRTPRAGRRSTWASPQDFEQACLHCFALIRGLVVIFRPFPSPSFFLPPFNPRTITSIRARDARKVGHRMPQGTKSVRLSPNSTMRGANISRKKPGGHDIEKTYRKRHPELHRLRCCVAPRQGCIFPRFGSYCGRGLFGRS